MATQSVTNEITIALQQFQASLSPEQKVQFSTSQSSSPSDVNGVLAFTAEVDALKQRRQARCVGSRLQTTLQSVQQFTSIVSTFVNSNPAVAALVWGSIRFTVLVASNWSTFFEKLTTWFLQMQACCPRFSDYQLLYPESTKLQEVLCSFYACLLRFCTKAMATINDTGPLNFARSMIFSFESQFASYLAELQSKSKSVKFEVELASHKAAANDRKLQIAERKDASKSRLSSKVFRTQLVRHTEQEQAWRKQLEQRHERARKQTLLNKLSSFDHIAPLKRERKKRFGDTGTWLVSTTKYRDWSASSSSSAFLLSGILGAGKTVLTTSVIDDLIISSQTQARKLAFFFCQHDNAVSLDLFAMLRSITRQSLTEDDISASIEPVLDRMLKETSSEDEMFALLIQIIRSLRLPLFLVIDGFDELARPCWHTLLSLLSQLLTMHDLDVKLFITSRENATSEIKDAFQKNLHHHSMRCRQSDDDIRRYIELSVDQRIEARELSVGDEDLVPTIKESLCKGASSMFLWVFFQIEELCAQLTDEDIIQTLQTLPKDLPSTYERLFSRIIMDKKQEIVRRMLAWALVSKRPLTVIELRDAIAIRPDQRQHEQNYLVNEADRMIFWCCNLLIVDEEDSVVRFPHYSVKEFLLSTCHSRQPSTEIFRFSELEVDIGVCHLCCTYLQFGDFERQMARSAPQMPNITPRDILNTALTSDGKSLIAQAWLNLKKIQSDKRQKWHAHPLNDLAKLAMKDFADEPTDEPTSWVMRFPLFAYANEYWSWHGSRLTPNFPSEWQSFQKLFDSTNVYIVHPLPDIDWEGPSDLELGTIAQRDHSALMQNSLRKMGALYLQDPAPLHRLVTLAIEHTSFEVLQKTTITGESTGSSVLPFMESKFEPVKIFELALKGGQAETAAWVLKCIGFIDQVTLDGFIRDIRQISDCSSSTYLKEVRILQTARDGDARTVDNFTKYFDIAEGTGPPQILSLLQSCVASFTDGPSYIVGRFSQAAAAEDHEIVARHLNAIKSACLARSQMIVVNTALAFAVKNAQFRHAQDLLIAGAFANLRLRGNFSLLHHAVFADLQACHSLLLRHGANPHGCGQSRSFFSLDDPHQKDGRRNDIPDVGCPLGYAIKLGRREIAWQLVEAGAGMKDLREHLPATLENAMEYHLKDTPVPKKLHIPLAYAIKFDRREIARDLLQAGAIVSGVEEAALPEATEGEIDDLQDMPRVGNLCSPLAYAIKLNRREIAMDLVQAAASVHNIEEHLLMTTTSAIDDNPLKDRARVKNFYSPLAYAIKLEHEGIARDLLQAGGDVKDIKKEDLPKTKEDEDLLKAMEDALQREDPYLIYLLSFRGYYERHKEPILYHYPSLRDAFTISQAHFDHSSTWPHLYQQDSLRRDEFQAIWLSYKADDERWPDMPAWNGM